MSGKAQLDLLVRVRYTNPLPPPPFPPKLLNIATDPKRYARVEFTQALSNDTPLPMVVDAECGMPLDLSHFDSLWDGSTDAQILSIEDTFPVNSEPIDLTTITHPTKPDVTAIEAFEFLPDTDLWANTYDVFRFAERPGERPIEAADLRLDCGVLRPQESDGEHFLSYYVTKEDDEAEEYKLHRRTEDDGLEEKPPIAFHWTRDYETAKVEQDITNEVLLVLDDLSLSDNGSRQSTHEVKGAYYTTIQRKIALRKKRAMASDGFIPNRFDVAKDKIDILQLSHQPFSADEEAERAEALSIINDPGWLARAKAAQEAREIAEADIFGGPDADGEEEDLPTHHHEVNGVNRIDLPEGMDDD
ncbi:hypothetical protein FRB99_000464 [Tulasnella sp. 403]|nr:hypothetical protein FRB99_000464 [Tulasnella sp. 403]